MAYERTQADQRMRSGKDQHSPVETFPHPSDEGKARDKGSSRLRLELIREFFAPESQVHLGRTSSGLFRASRDPQLIDSYRARKRV